MCVGFYPLAMGEAEAVLSSRAESKSHAPTSHHEFNPVHDARPGLIVPVYFPDKWGANRTENPPWDFPLEGKPAAFNTQLESALRQLRDRRRGMWGHAMAERRYASYQFVRFMTLCALRRFLSTVARYLFSMP